MGHAKANCLGWQEGEAQRKQLRRGDDAEVSLLGTCIAESIQRVHTWGL